MKAMEYYEKAAELDNVDGYCRAALYLANGYSGVTDAMAKVTWETVPQNPHYLL